MTEPQNRDGLTVTSLYGKFPFIQTPPWSTLNHSNCLTLATLTHSNPLWHILDLPDPPWPTLDPPQPHSDPLWPTLSYSNSLWPTLTHANPLWPTLTHANPLWLTLTDPDPLWPTLIHSDPLWPVSYSRWKKPTWPRTVPVPVPSPQHCLSIPSARNCGHSETLRSKYGWSENTGFTPSHPSKWNGLIIKVVLQ